MTEKIESQGKTVEAAVSEALLRMGARRDEVEIKILEEPKSGFLGLLGGRQARVLVRRKPRRRGGGSHDYRENDDGYKAHNLSGGRDSSRRRGGGRPAGADSGRQENRNERTGGGGSRGRRGGQGRPQESQAQKPAQGDDQNKGRDGRQNQPARPEGEGRRSRGRRGGRNRRGGEGRPEARPEARSEARPEARGGGRPEARKDMPGGKRQEPRSDNRQDDRQDNRQDNRPPKQEARPEARQGRNQRQERRPAAQRDSQAPVEAQTRPSAAAAAETRPVAPPVAKAEEKTKKSRSHRPGGLGSRARRGQKKPPREQVVARAEEVVTDTPVVETPVVETPVKETPVVETQAKTPEVKPVAAATTADAKTETPAEPKPRRAFGGLGARLREQKRAARAAAKQAETGGAPPEPGNAGPPARPTSRSSYAEGPSRDRNRRSSRPPARPDARDEVILAGIAATKYAAAVRDVPESEWDKTLTEMTDGMLARAGFPCEVETRPGEYRQVRITTDDESAGMLIGRHGQAIDAIEHLVDRMASNAAGDRVRMNLDINDYRLRREEMLVEKVVEAAETIREDGRSIHMEPMSARERRVVHLEAEKIAGLRTFTMVGSGGKHVVIAAEEKQGETGSGDADPGDDFHEQDET